jgi:hypothetical protein
MRCRVALLVGIAVSVLASATSAMAHEDGVLTLATRELAAGDSMRVGGEQFSRNAELTLVLVGTRGRVVLGEVSTDAAGAFSTDLAVPADLLPGGYRLVALAADGDESATLEVSVVPGSAPRAPPRTHDEDPAAPTAEPLRLERARSLGVTGGALLGIAGAVLLGVALLRTPGERPNVHTVSQEREETQ